MNIEQAIYKYTLQHATDHVLNHWNYGTKYRNGFHNSTTHRDTAWDAKSHTQETVEVRESTDYKWFMHLWDASGRHYLSAFVYDTAADAIAAATVVGDVLMDVPTEHLFA